MNIHFIQHEECEAPGALLLWAKKRGHNVSFTRLWLGEKLPESQSEINEIDFLIVLGGPQSPATSLEECPHFDSRAEQNLIKKCAEAKKIVLGFCLGAQLIGESFGAKFEHSPQKEVGVVKISLTDEAKKDAFFKDFPQDFDCGSWHNDMPGLAKESVVLAKSEGCPRQIVRYAKKVYGFQCHPEFTKEVVSLLLRDSSADIADAGKKPFVQTEKQILSYDYSRMNLLLQSFLDKLTSEP